MAINNIVVLGNNFETYFISCFIKTLLPNTTVKIFTNNQDYRGSFNNAISLPLSTSGNSIIGLFHKMGIMCPEIFSSTHSNVGLGIEYQGVADNSFITHPTKILNPPVEMIKYAALINDYKQNENFSTIFYDYFDWLIYKQINLLDSLTLFPVTGYNNNPERGWFFNINEMFVDDTAHTFNIAHQMPVTCHVSALKDLLLTKLSSLNVEIITDQISSIQITTTPNTEHENYDAIKANDKLISSLNVASTNFDVDYCVDCGIDHDDLNSYLNDNQTNQTQPFVCVKTYRSSKHDLDKHNTFKVEAIPNGVRLYNVYRHPTETGLGMTWHKEYQLVDTDVDTINGEDVSQFLPGVLSDITSKNLSNQQTSSIIDVANNGNYILFDLNRVSLNGIMSEEMSFVQFIGETIAHTLSLIDNENSDTNKINHLSSLNEVYKTFLKDCELRSYLTLEGSSVDGLSSFSNISQDYEVKINEWKTHLPFLNETIAQGNIRGINLASSKLKYESWNIGSPFQETHEHFIDDLDLQLVADQKYNLLPKNNYNNNGNLFDSVTNISTLLKSQFYIDGPMNVETFTNTFIK